MKTLKRGKILDIFTDFKEEKGYEGKAILVKKIRNGDSFYLDDESVKVPDKKEYTEEETKTMNMYARLTKFFKGDEDWKPYKNCKNLHKELMMERRDEKSDIKRMTTVLRRYRTKFKTSAKKIATVLNEFTDDYIIRYIQQDRRNWEPNIYTYERWEVRFIEDSTGWNTDYVTQRNIRVLACVNPTSYSRGDEISKFTTYNSVRSCDIKTNHVNRKYNVKKKEEETESPDELDYLSDDEMDLLIKKKKKK